MTDSVFLLAVITFFAVSVGNVFIAFDNIPFFDAPFSILDIFIALLLFDLISWFILRVITSKDKQDSEGREIAGELESNKDTSDQFIEGYDDTWSND